MSDTKSYMKLYLKEGLEKLAFEKEDAASIAEYFYQVMDEDMMKQALEDRQDQKPGIGWLGRAGVVGGAIVGDDIGGRIAAGRDHERVLEMIADRVPRDNALIHKTLVGSSLGVLGGGYGAYKGIQAYQAHKREQEKQAAELPGMGYIFDKAVHESAGKAGVALALGAGVLGAKKLYSAMVGDPMARRRFDAALEQAIARNQILQHADREKLDTLANTLFRYAPHASADPNLISSILSDAIMMDSIGPQTLQALLNLEKTYNETNKFSLSDSMAKG